MRLAPISAAPRDTSSNVDGSGIGVGGVGGVAPLLPAGKISGYINGGTELVGGVGSRRGAGGIVGRPPLREMSGGKESGISGGIGPG